MPKGVRKKAHELTGDEVMQKLFGKRIAKHLKRAANPDEHKEKKNMEGS